MISISKTLITMLLLLPALPVLAQELSREIKIETVKNKVDTLQDQVDNLIGEFGKEKKLKISGYIQAQYQYTNKETGFISSPYNPDEYINSRFALRRSRIKVKYTSGIVGLVVQSDLTNKGFFIKDAYLKITDPWTKFFTFKAGIFNRPVYEVEYSSSKRESPERSMVTRNLYPGERDMGFAFVIKPKDWFQLDIAAFNNTYKTMYLELLPNFSSYPFYSIIRLKRDFLLSDKATLTLGGHTRIGKMSANTNNIILPENNENVIDSTTYSKGSGLSRTWYGVEGQLYWDVLSGLKIAAAYMWGNNVNIPSEDGSAPLRMRKFNGYYIYFIKNIGKDWQAVAKYNYYDPNTAIPDADIISSKDLGRGVLGLGIHNYSVSNVRFTLWYDFVNTQTVAAFPDSPQNDLLTFRAQLKF